MVEIIHYKQSYNNCLTGDQNLAKISFEFFSDKKIQSLNFSLTKTAGAFVVQVKDG